MLDIIIASKPPIALIWFENIRKFKIAYIKNVSI